MDIYDMVELTAVLLTPLLGLILFAFPNKMVKKEYRNDKEVVKNYRKKGFVLFIIGLLCFVMVLILKLKE